EISPLSLHDALPIWVPFAIVAGTLWLIWWYVVIHQQVTAQAAVEGVQQLWSAVATTGPTAAELGAPESFYWWFGIIAVICLLWQIKYYRKLDADRLEIIKLL